MINNLLEAKNRPIGVSENRPSEQLVQGYGPGKWISNKELEELAIEIYKKNGKGITINDLIQRFSIHQEKAQRRLKNAIKGKEDKQGILFTLDRKNPQQYYPTRLKAKIIEHIKKQNRLRGLAYFNTHILRN